MLSVEFGCSSGLGVPQGSTNFSGLTSRTGSGSGFGISGSRGIIHSWNCPDVKAELAGTYVLPRLPEIPKPEPEPVREVKPEKLVDPCGTPSPEEQAEFHAQHLLGNSVRELDEAARQFLIHGRRAGLQ